MKYIQKVKIKNFKKFKEFEIELSNSTNLIIGDNESGKSTILSAIDLVLSASKNKIESIGLEALFNKEVIKEFLAKENKSITELPIIQIDLHIAGIEEEFEFEGKNNLNNISSYGVKLLCEPDEEYFEYIANSLKQDQNFPFEFYKLSFSTFANSSYSKYKKMINYVLLDSSNINSEYATGEYIKKVYNSIIDNKQRTLLRSNFSSQRDSFNKNHLISHSDDNYNFALRGGSKFSLENNITITESDIPLEHRGKGKQCFIKADFVLKRNESTKGINLLLLEEPENHLSHSNMKKLIERISNSSAKQMLITTHNNLIASRLNLRNSIILNSKNTKNVKLDNLDQETADFFTKAPDNNVLQYVLSKKVILVEGDAEFILMEDFYKKIKGNLPEKNDVYIISVGGLSFKRYLEISKILEIKTAVITDNDTNYNKNILLKYKDYHDLENIKIYSDEDESLSTFEICLYSKNRDILDTLIKTSNKIKDVQINMLNNKSSTALKILNSLNSDTTFNNSFVIPQYIQDAIEWISE